jgi:hypothetical protein
MAHLAISASADAAKLDGARRRQYVLANPFARRGAMHPKNSVRALAVVADEMVSPWQTFDQVRE